MSAPLPKCRWCGGSPHPGEWCPLVKAIVYDDTVLRTIKRVEFHSPSPIFDKAKWNADKGVWDD